MIESILNFSIGAISVSAIIIFISKAIFNRWMDMRVLQYENELNLKLEEFKIEKQRLADKYKVRYTKLHEDRAEVIKKLYTKLVDMQDYLSLYVKDIKASKIETGEFKYIRNKLFESIPDFMNYSNRNKIFFDEKTLFAIKEIEAITNIVVQSYEQDFEDGSDFKNSEEWHELAMRLINNEIPSFRKDLEIRFRLLLGSDEN